jgi:hypothetical protein
MAWQPPDNIGDNEHMGRRLFDEPMLVGATDQPPYGGIRLNHFEENRGDEYSLDRLGSSGIDRRVLSYLKPRAQNQGNSFRRPKPFSGWAVVAARELSKAKRPPVLELVASPLVEPEPKDNKYHAHAKRPPHFDDHVMALHLRFLFTQYGRVETVDQPSVVDVLRRYWLFRKSEALFRSCRDFIGI